MVIEGLNGGALQFDGVDDIIQIPDSEHINATVSYLQVKLWLDGQDDTR